MRLVHPFPLHPMSSTYGKQLQGTEWVIDSNSHLIRVNLTNVQTYQMI